MAGFELIMYGRFSGDQCPIDKCTGAGAVGGSPKVPAGALAIGGFVRSRWRLRRTRGSYWVLHWRFEICSSCKGEVGRGNKRVGENVGRSRSGDPVRIIYESKW